MNPIADIFRKFGLTNESAASITGMDLSLIEAVMRDPPDNVAGASFRLLAACGLRFKINMGESLTAWIDRPYLSSLYADNNFRADMGFLPWTPRRVDVIRLLQRLRSEDGDSFGAIAKRLEANWIPSTAGGRQWRKTTVAIQQDRKLDLPWFQEEIVPSEEFLADWQCKVVDMVTSKLLPFDPVAAMRYEIQISETGSIITLQSSGPMPAGPRQWIVDHLTSRTWLAGRWGLGVPLLASM